MQTLWEEDGFLQIAQFNFDLWTWQTRGTWCETRALQTGLVPIMSWQDSINHMVVTLVNRDYENKNTFLSVHHRVQCDQFLQRGGTSVLLQDEVSTIGWKQNILPSAASWLGVLPASASTHLRLTLLFEHKTNTGVLYVTVNPSNLQPQHFNIHNVNSNSPALKLKTREESDYVFKYVDTQPGGGG